MPALADVNGEISLLEEARLPILDRGLLFGDGVYETLVTAGGRLRCADRHFARLEHSLSQIGIEGVKLSDVHARVENLWRRSGMDEAEFYLQITRGVQSQRSHVWPEDLQPSIIVTVSPRQPPAAEVYRTGVALISRPDLRWGRCDIKSTNLLANVQARQAAQQAGGFEALLVKDGCVTEGSGSSVFMVRNSRLIVPPLSPAILPGTTRELTLELAENLGLAVELAAQPLEEYFRADEVFITSARIGVLPVREIDGRSLPEQRPVTLRLMTEYIRYLEPPLLKSGTDSL